MLAVQMVNISFQAKVIVFDLIMECPMYAEDGMFTKDIFVMNIILDYILTFHRMLQIFSIL
jgi:hypothetical protein